MVSRVRLFKIGRLSWKATLKVTFQLNLGDVEK